MPNSWKAASLLQILPAMVSRIAAVTGLDASRVIVSVLSPDEVPTFAAPQDIIVRLMHESPDAAIIDGAGRFDDRRERELQVAVRTRLFLDQSGQDYQRLLNASLGHVRTEDRLCEALEMFNVPDGADVLTAPLRLGNLSAPARMKSNPDWVYSAWSVQVTYRRDLDTSLDAQFGS